VLKLKKLGYIISGTCILLVIIIISQNSYSGYNFENEKYSELKIDESPIKSTFNSQAITAPIYINGDGDFSVYGFPGNGLKNDPYRIENLTFNNGTVNMILVVNTNAYYLIQNCTLKGLNGVVDAMRFNNADNGIIRNNTIHNCRRGMQIVFTKNIEVYKNKIYNTSSFHGIDCQYTNDSKLYENTIYDTGWGIYIRRCTNLTANTNILYNNYYGIYNDESVNSMIKNNQANTSTDSGIYVIHDNQNLTIRDNLCHDNTLNGIFMITTTDIYVYNNTITWNGYGISSSSSTNIVLEKNIVTDNSNNGFGNNNVNHTIIKNNDIRRNNRGISGQYTYNFTILNNTIINNSWGVRFVNSRNTTICLNYIFNSFSEAIYLEGIVYYEFVNISKNTIVNSPSEGIYLEEVSYASIYKNNFTNNIVHIEFLGVKYSYIGYNNITLGNWAIHILDSAFSNKNNTIEYNRITGLHTGILLYGEGHNTSINNNYLENYGSICLHIDNSRNVEVKNNIFIGDYYGIRLGGTANNTIFEWNSLIGFSDYVSDSGWFNIFQYNYYDLWIGPDANHDGYVDIPLALNGSSGNEDPYPIAASSLLDNDQDGLLNFEEYLLGTDSENNDTDSDLLLDGAEVYVHFTNPLLNDTDADQLLDGEEIISYGTNPLSNDTDSDNLSDGDEVLTHGTSPTNPDTDTDLMPDGWEVDYSLDPLVNDAASDADFDDLTNYNEYLEGTNPQNNDTEGDGMPDGWEVINSLNPLADDSAEDPDMDGLTNLQEFGYLTDPNNEDTDGDTWTDGDEIDAGTDPLDPNDFPVTLPNYPGDIIEDPLLITIIVGSSLIIVTAVGTLAVRSLIQNITTKVSDAFNKVTLNDNIMGSIQDELGGTVEDIADEFKKIDICHRCGSKGYGPYCHVCGNTINAKIADILKRSAKNRK